MRPDDVGISGSRPGRWSRARRNHACHTGSPRRGTSGAGRTSARRPRAACTRRRRRRAASRQAAAPQPVPQLVRRLGDGGRDLAAAQVPADHGTGVGFVAQHPLGRVLGRPGAPPRDLQLTHQRHEGRGIVLLPGAGPGVFVRLRERPVGGDLVLGHLTVIAELGLGTLTGRAIRVRAPSRVAGPGTAGRSTFSPGRGSSTRCGPGPTAT